MDPRLPGEPGASLRSPNDNEDVAGTRNWSKGSALTPPALFVALAPSEPPPGALRSGSMSRWPRRSWVVAAVAVVLCAGAVVCAFSKYNDATKPDRSAPDVVVDSYLQAFLVDRDDSEAAQFTCQDAAGLEDFVAFRSTLTNRERALGVHISVSWGALDVSPTGPSAASVSVTLTESATIDGTVEDLNSQWIFEDHQDPEWRVCSATMSR